MRYQLKSSHSLFLHTWNIHRFGISPKFLLCSDNPESPESPEIGSPIPHPPCEACTPNPYQSALDYLNNYKNFSNLIIRSGIRPSVLLSVFQELSQVIRNCIHQHYLHAHPASTEQPQPQPPQQEGERERDEEQELIRENRAQKALGQLTSDELIAITCFLLSRWGARLFDPLSLPS